MSSIFTLPLLPVVYGVEPLLNSKAKSRATTARGGEAGAGSSTASTAADDDGEPQAQALLSKDQDSSPVDSGRGCATLALVIGSIAGAWRQMLLPIALTTTSIRNAGMVQPAVPLLTALLGSIFGLNRTTKWTFLPLMIICGGLAVAGEVWKYDEVDQGFWLLIAYPILKSIQMVALTKAALVLPANRLQVGQAFGAFVVVAPIMGAAEIYFNGDRDLKQLPTHIGSLSWIGWSCVIVSAALLVTVRWRLQIAGYKVIGAIEVSVYQSLQAVFATVIGWLFLGETATIFAIGGLVMVCGGVGLYSYMAHRGGEAPEADEETDLEESPDVTDDEKLMVSQMAAKR